MEPEERRDDVFVIPICGEATNGAEALRGGIQHVASGRDRYFSNLGDLCDFILALGARMASWRESCS